MPPKSETLHHVEIATEKVRILVGVFAISYTGARELFGVSPGTLRKQAFSEVRNVGFEYRWADQAECERFEVRYSGQKATLLPVSCHISCPG